MAFMSTLTVSAARTYNQLPNSLMVPTTSQAQLHRALDFIIAQMISILRSVIFINSTLMGLNERLILYTYISMTHYKSLISILSTYKYATSSHDLSFFSTEKYF
jgi:hypothetical protein